MLVTVIITTHQGRLEFLKKALKSVQAQTYEDLEIIVVDDGSTDGTAEYIKRQNDLRIHYIHRETCFGSDTRPKNDGLKAATGEYVAYLDGDNQFLPDHIQILVNEVTRTPELDVAYGDRMVYDLIEANPPQIGVYSDFNLGLLFNRNFIDTSDSLIRRSSLLYIGGWDERYTKYVDWNLYLRLAKAGFTFKRVKQVITQYYRHKKAKSLTVQTDKERGMRANIPDWNPLELEVRLPFLGEIRKPKVAVFSLTKDRLEYTKTCFKSLNDNAGYPYDHYVIDNGSTDGTKEYLDLLTGGYKPAFLHAYPQNVGISKASNRVLNAIGDQYDIIIKYDNDCLSVTKGWLAEIVKLYETNHLMCWSPYPEGLRDNPGGAPREDYWRIKDHLVGVTSHLGGLCHVAPAGVYKKFRWDENQPLHGMQDTELSQWLIKHGYGMGYVEDLRVQHYEGTEGQHKRYPEYFKKRLYEKTHTE